MNFNRHPNVCGHNDYKTTSKLQITLVLKQRIVRVQHTVHRFDLVDFDVTLNK